MANGTVNLVISEKRTGNAFAELGVDVQKADDAIKRVGRDTKGFAKVLSELGGPMGAVGGLLRDLLTGGLWAAGAKSFELLVDGLKKHHQLMKDARLAARGLSREYMSLEAAARGYHRRVDQWRKAKAESDAAEADAARAAKKAEEDAKRAALIHLGIEKEYYTLQQQIISEKRKAALIDADDLTRAKAMAEELREQAELRVRLAQRDIDAAKVKGSLSEQMNAEEAMKFARLQVETAVKEGEKMIRDAEKKIADEAAAAAKKAADEKAKAEEDAAKKRRDAEKKAAQDRIDAIRKEHQAKMDALNEEIRKAHDEAQILEQNAQRARGGKTFGEWERGERDIARDQRRADIRQRNVVGNAQRELSRLEANARRGRAFTNAHDRARMARLREFIADQDPANNPALKRAAELEKQRNEAEAKMQKDVDAIRKAIEGKVEL